MRTFETLLILTSILAFLLQEELQRRRKANEKAQKLVQNAIVNEKTKKNASSTELSTAAKTQSLPENEASAANVDQKAVKNKNLQHRPLKLKDKENESNKRRPSTENDSKSPPDKANFKESEELQRIRQILNQGKKDKKPANSENTVQGSETAKTKGPVTSQESKRKISDSKSPKNSSMNGLASKLQSKPLQKQNRQGPNAGLHAYVASRKINFDTFDVPPTQNEQSDEQVTEEADNGRTINITI